MHHFTGEAGVMTNNKLPTSDKAEIQRKQLQLHLNIITPFTFMYTVYSIMHRYQFARIKYFSRPIIIDNFSTGHEPQGVVHTSVMPVILQPLIPDADLSI